MCRNVSLTMVLFPRWAMMPGLVVLSLLWVVPQGIARAAPPVTVTSPPAAATGAPAAPGAGSGPLGPSNTPTSTSPSSGFSPAPGRGTGGGQIGPASPVPPTAQTAAGVSGASQMGGEAGVHASDGAAAGGGAVVSDGGAGGQLVAPRIVLTADATAAESDHDAVVGAWGIEVHPVTTTLPVFSRRASTGCPIAPVGTPDGPAATSTCPPVDVGMLGVRHWVNRNLAWTAGAALAVGGGSQRGRLLDSYLGFGPSAGVSILLGNWRHLAIAASPALSLVWFKAAGSTPTTYVADLRADLEGELHLGFIGAPALSLTIRSGMLLRLEKSAELTVWSAGIAGATSLRALVSDLTLRYYF